MQIAMLPQPFPIAPASNAQKPFYIHVPGLGRIASYNTVMEAANALHYLPYRARLQATIRDQDGHPVTL